MKKILGVSLLCAGLASSAICSDEKAWYIGFGMLNGSGKHTQELSTGYKIEGDIDSKATQIKIGKDNGVGRVEFTYTANELDEDGYKSDFNGIDIDFGRKFTDNTVKPYLSVGFGFHAWDGFKGTTSNGSVRDRQAVSFNYGLGALYQVSMFEIEAAYKGKYYAWEDIEYATYTREDSTHVSGLYLGLNLRF